MSVEWKRVDKHPPPTGKVVVWYKTPGRGGHVEELRVEHVEGKCCFRTEDGEQRNPPQFWCDHVGARAAEADDENNQAHDQEV